MMRIVLFCAGGISTSFLVQNMKKALLARGLEGDITACSESTMENTIRASDVILLAPQARYVEDKVNRLCRQFNKPYANIPPQIYGRMNGEAALDLALSLIRQ